MSIHEKALDSIFDDMDDMESKKMFGDKKIDGGNGITITITTGNDDQDADGDMPEFKDGDHDQSLCKGGCAYHKGGMVPEMGETDDLSLPPFLRKKSIPSNK